MQIWNSSKTWIQNTLNCQEFTLNRKTLPSCLFAAIGLFGLFPIFKSVLNSIFSLTRQRSLLKIKSLYGQSAEGISSWVLITGASDGIGKSYAKLFASMGFNLILVSRNLEKLQKVEEEVKDLYEKAILIKLIAVDFSEKFTREDIINQIVNQVRDLDISILVNNVGIGGAFPGDQVNFKTISKLIHVNINIQIILTQALLPQLIQRSSTDFPTGIINYSSSLGKEFCFPYMSLYGGTKSFNDAFSNVLSMEYPNLDIISVRPGEVKTNMTRGRGNITPDAHVRSVVRFLGVKNETHGSASHEVISKIGPSLINLARKGMRKAMNKAYEDNYKNEIMKDNF